MATSRSAPLSRTTSLQEYCSTVRSLASCAEAGRRPSRKAQKDCGAVNGRHMRTVIIFTSPLICNRLDGRRPMHVWPPLNVTAPSVPG